MTKTIQFQAIIDGVTLKKDGTLTIKLGTQELSPEETAHIFEKGNMQVWTAIAESPISVEDLEIPEQMAETETKSPSQRLRNAIYVLWKAKEDPKYQDAQNLFYKDKMERIINWVKEEISRYDQN